MPPTFSPPSICWQAIATAHSMSGVTSNLMQRLHQHRTGATGGFTSDYGVHRLVWFETGASMEDAIRREKQIKRWNRPWKINLIERENPDWRELAVDLSFEMVPETRRVD